MLNVDEVVYYSQYNTQQEHQLVVPDPGSSSATGHTMG